ncbi:MAG: penicillin-binding protein 2 [Coriobacteriaceae bacterium]|jgi:penicillin-binding protein 2|nr:penicillin-binding protein 2 [Coriobacteriaceae bacterium]
MILAIAAILITLTALAVGVLVAYRISRKKKSSQISAGKHSVESIKSIGMPSSVGSGAKGSRGILQVNQSPMKAINPLEKLRLRLVAMGVFTAAVFGSLGVRLWGMQVLTNDEYRQKAEENTFTTVSTTAPRGYIFDSDGIPLVKNRTSLTVLADAEVARDRAVVQRLSALLGVPHNIVRQRIQDSSSGAQSQRVVARNVRLRDVAFIAEHATAFPGVTTQTRTTREYPWGALAAHVLGYTGPVSEDDMKAFREGSYLEMGDTVGKSGIEAVYDTVLSGDHGQRVVVADADGTVRQVVSETAPTKGNDIYLTLRAPVQQVADRALAALVAPTGDIGTGKGVAASLVCMDVSDGGIIALANYPTYTPESFIGGIPQEVWDLFSSAESFYPLFNRAIAGGYPAASTFKAFTGLAGFEHGFADATREWDCQGSWTGFGEDDEQKCWNLSGHGHLNFRSGVVVSCDVVFYEIAKGFYDERHRIGETALQEFIKRFGFGTLTGIDLDGEQAGRIPDAEWKTEAFRNVPEGSMWVPGDLSNMSIGQGDVLVTPIQMAAGYAAVATGRLVKPHLLKEVKNSEGNTVVAAKAEEEQLLDVSPEHLAIMRDALKGVAEEDANVSRAFAENDIRVPAAAKTGTAEVKGKKDYGWFACYAPFDAPRYVVACVVEQGGAGALSACPVSAQVLSAALSFDEGTLSTVLAPVPGSSGKSVPLPDDNNAGSPRRTD